MRTVIPAGAIQTIKLGGTNDVVSQVKLQQVVEGQADVDESLCDITLVAEVFCAGIQSAFAEVLIVPNPAPTTMVTTGKGIW